MKNRPFEQLFSVGTGFCMGFLKSSKTDHNPFLFKNCKYKAKAAQIKRFIVSVRTFPRVGHGAGQSFFISSRNEGKTSNMIAQMTVQFVSS